MGNRQSNVFAVHFCMSENLQRRPPRIVQRRPSRIVGGAGGAELDVKSLTRGSGLNFDGLALGLAGGAVLADAADAATRGGRGPHTSVHSGPGQSPGALSVSRPTETQTASSVKDSHVITGRAVTFNAPSHSATGTSG